MGWLDAQRTHRPIGPFDDDPVTRALLAGAFAALAMLIALLPPWFLETRLIEGVNAWTKPQKFNLSFIVHFMTLAILAQFVPRETRVKPALSVSAYLAVAALVLETVYIFIQAARGRRSHFNYETQLEASLYLMMGVGAVLLMIVAIVLGVQIWRKGAAAGPGLRLGAAMGLILGGVLTIVLAGYMSSGNNGRWVGDHPMGGAAVPLFGWSREVGDLRPAHFVTMHMMQTLPLAGWLLDKLRAPGSATRIALIVFALAQIALAFTIFFQALAGDPFWPV
ncbi:MAG: hypothetical protein AAFW81_00535 [Pseudomonadota bacterium]